MKYKILNSLIEKLKNILLDIIKEFPETLKYAYHNIMKRIS